MKISCLLAGLFLCLTSLAQDAEIKVLHRVRNDSVILRWAPNSAVAWQLGNKYGYRVTRTEINNSGDSIFVNRKILAGNIKPVPLDDWESLVHADKFAAIAAQAIYGDDFIIDDPNQDAIGFFNQVSELQNRFGFSLFAADMSLSVARAMGLMVIDVSFEKNKDYIYKVELVKNSSDYVVESGANVIDTGLEKELPQSNDVRAEFGDGSVKITWDIFYDQGIYIAYQIERSEDGKNFITRNKVPYTVVDKQGQHLRKLSYLDSLDRNYKVYYYRVRGITSFDETGPPSAMVQGTGIPSARGVIATFDTSYVDSEGQAVLRWRYPQGMVDNISGFVVGRSNKANGPFVDVSHRLPPTETTFRHKDLFPVNYYVVKAIGLDSVVTTSLPTLIQPEDSIAPSAPTALIGRIDTIGNVYLNWKPGAEYDLAGYRVYRANRPDEEFMQITSALVTYSEFKDSILLETLSEEVFYKIVAADHRDNLSDFSTILKLARPDRVPPAAAVFKNYVSDSNGILLSWINSSSADVAGHVLKRIDEKGDSVAIDLQKGQNTYLDKNTEKGKYYSYSLAAKDDAGLYSPEVRVNIQSFSSGMMPAIKKVRARVDREMKQIILLWEYGEPDVSKYVIYRSKGDEPMRFYRSIDFPSHEFVDESPAINNIYKYKLKAIFQNDDESSLSDLVEVLY